MNSPTPLGAARAVVSFVLVFLGLALPWLIPPRLEGHVEIWRGCFLAWLLAAAALAVATLRAAKAEKEPRPCRLLASLLLPPALALAIGAPLLLLLSFSPRPALLAAVLCALLVAQVLILHEVAADTQ